MQTLYITVSLLLLILNVDQISCFGNGYALIFAIYAGRHLVELVSNLHKPRIRSERASPNNPSESQIDLSDATERGESEPSNDIAFSDDTSFPESSGAYDRNVAWPRWEKLVWTYGR
uniref:Pecanex-like protein n=1 Tax=Ascaris lumbricoides TaxID=6252 RepID=A0A0M3IS28_ASCLU